MFFATYLQIFIPFYLVVLAAVTFLHIKESPCMVFGQCIKIFASYRSVEWQAYFHQCGAEADYGQSCNHHADPKPSIQANALERLRKQML